MAGDLNTGAGERKMVAAQLARGVHLAYGNAADAPWQMPMRLDNPWIWLLLFVGYAGVLIFVSWIVGNVFDWW